MRHKSGPTRAIELLPWVPALLGVAALAAFLAVAVVRLSTPEQHRLLLPAPAPALSYPTPVSGSAAPRTSDVPVQQPPAGRVTPASQARTTRPPATTRPAPPPPPPSPVTGSYSVLSSYGDSFIGQVLISNGATTPRDWTVTVTFAGNVGDPKATWLESLPQPTLSRSGQTYTWRSSTPLAAGSSGELRFDFARTGSGDTPTRCTVNGSPCR